MRLHKVTTEDVLIFTPEDAEMRFTPWGTAIITMAAKGMEHTYVQFEADNDDTSDTLLNLADTKTPIQATGAMKTVTTNHVTYRTLTVTTWKAAIDEETERRADNFVNRVRAHQEEINREG